MSARHDDALRLARQAVRRWRLNCQTYLPLAEVVWMYNVVIQR